MKGIILNLAEEVISAEHGEQMWDAVLDGAGVVGSYTSLGSYPDVELACIVASAARLLGTDDASLLRHVAEGAIPLLALRYPEFFRPHQDARSFVLTLNDIIHPEVRKLYPGADVPSFAYRLHGECGVTLEYDSGRRLCVLAEGFIHGAAMYFGQQVSVGQVACMLRGDAVCLLRCEFRDA